MDIDTVEFVPPKELATLRQMAKKYYTEHERIADKYLMPVLRDAIANGNIDTLSQLVDFLFDQDFNEYTLFGYVRFETVRAIRLAKENKDGTDD